MITVSTRRKSQEENPDLALINQLDELQRASQDERDRQLGANWFKECTDFYALVGGAATTPSFRPRVQVPQLQMITLADATDLSDALPRIYILHKTKRDKDREKAFQEHWRQSYFNNEIFMANLWSYYSGTGFLQVGFDPTGRRGRGEVWIEARDPSTCYPDPGAKHRCQWVYVQFEDKMYLDEIIRRWPDQGRRLHARGPTVKIEGGTSQVGLELPDGPLRASGGMPAQRLPGDSRLSVRHTFINDFSTEVIDKEERDRVRETLKTIPIPRRKLKFPHGRWIVDCEGVVLVDGDNTFPFRIMPLIPVHAMPGLNSSWCPPPIRYTKNLQELAQRHMTQNFENSVRINNGVWFIDARTGLNAEEFGGIPAQICIINPNSPVPEFKVPQALGPQHMKIPADLLQLQKELWGMTAARQGQPGAGNVGASLYDSSVFQAQTLTRMRSRLIAPAIQELAEAVFFTMGRFYRDGQAFPGFGGQTEDGFEMHQWKGINSLDDYDIFLDPASIAPISQSALRQLVMMLLDKGHMPLEYALKMLDIPDADEIADAQRSQMEIAAMAKLKRPR